MFLEQHVFYDLNNLNDGFDVETIRYFSKSDFEKVLKRVEFFGLEIYGLEPWPDKEFAGVRLFEEYEMCPNDPEWYWSAFREFVNEGVDSYFSASYGVPKKIMNIFSNQ